jgi:hypothetical protein
VWRVCVLGDIASLLPARARRAASGEFEERQVTVVFLP